MFRDPRAKASGGRTPWREPLSAPCIVEQVKGNRLTLRTQDGRSIEAHAEDVLVVPPSAELLEVEPLDLIPAEDQPRSLAVSYTHLTLPTNREV